ncbi:MAG TPA: hypothetical protein VL728_09650 [Cyclobacteriaceae bacterium]|jgi:hypothetical protein|nr:hypothetical protein [Cyclobacteriaceae bacterium]
MKSLLVPLFLLCLWNESSSQTFPFDLWHQGKVITVNKDTIKGLVKYDRENFLQIRHDDKIEICNSSKVASFEIFDQSYKRSRQFFTLPYSTKGEYKTPFFFELISSGKLTVLSREAIIAKTNVSTSRFSAPKIYYYLVDKYFLLEENGNIESLRGKKKDWNELFADRSGDVKNYMRTNKLDLSKKYELKQIIDYYNSIIGK